LGGGFAGTRRIPHLCHERWEKYGHEVPEVEDSVNMTRKRDEIVKKTSC
jgi:hypothetical protein